MTLVSGTKNVVIFGGLKSGVVIFLVDGKCPRRSIPVQTNGNYRSERLQTKIAGVKINTCNQT